MFVGHNCRSVPRGGDQFSSWLIEVISSTIDQRKDVLADSIPIGAFDRLSEARNATSDGRPTHPVRCARNNRTVIFILSRQ